MNIIELADRVEQLLRHLQRRRFVLAVGDDAVDEPHVVGPLGGESAAKAHSPFLFIPFLYFSSFYLITLLA